MQPACSDFLHVRVRPVGLWQHTQLFMKQTQLTCHCVLLLRQANGYGVGIASANGNWDKLTQTLQVTDKQLHTQLQPVVRNVDNDLSNGMAALYLHSVTSLHDVDCQSVK